MDSIMFKQSVINYLLNFYSQSYEWYFNEEGLVCEYDGCVRIIYYDQLVDTYNLFLTDGFYFSTFQPLWQCELDKIINGG